MPIRRRQFIFLKKYKYFLLSVFAILGIVISFATEHKHHTEPKQEKISSEKSAREIFLEGKYEDYLEFINDQPKEKKLEWKQFKEIQDQGNCRINKCEWKEEIKKIVSILQMSQENRLKEMFAALKENGVLEKEGELFETAFFTYISSIGETSHSLFTKDVYANLLRLKKGCLLLKNGSPDKAFSYYKRRLANTLELDLGSPINRFLLKEAMEKHIYTKGEIQKVKESLLELSVDSVSKLIQGELLEVPHLQEE